MLLTLSFLLESDKFYLFVVLASPVTVLFAQGRLVSFQLGHTLVEVVIRFEQSLACAHTTHRTHRVVDNLILLEQRRFLALQIQYALLRLGYLLRYVVPRRTHILGGQRWSVLARNDRHIYRGVTWGREDVTFGGHIRIKSIDQQSEHRSALADVDSQHTVIGDVGARPLYEAVAADGLLDGHQIDLVDGLANRGYFALHYPTTHILARNE